ncbi:hypothetical protein ACFL0V_06420 [Nanoarchaeota archaeon]
MKKPDYGNNNHNTETKMKGIGIATTTVIILLISISFISYENTYDSIENEILTIPEAQVDLIPEGGTVVWWIDPAKFDESIKSKNLLLLTSQDPSINIIYDFSRDMLIGGKPQMQAKIPLLTPIKLAYTFEKGGKQNLFANGKLLISSKYLSESLMSVTGMSIHDQQDITSLPKNLIKIKVFNHVLSQKELSSLSQ